MRIAITHCECLAILISRKKTISENSKTQKWLNLISRKIQVAGKSLHHFNNVPFWMVFSEENSVKSPIFRKRKLAVLLLEKWHLVSQIKMTLGACFRRFYNFTVRTVWKFQNFSATQILREIKFGDGRSSKSAIFTYLELWILIFMSFYTF